MAPRKKKAKTKKSTRTKRSSKPKAKPRPKRVLYDALEYDDNGWYCLDGVPYTGIAYSRHEDGWLTFEAEYRKGLEWGMRRHWYGPKQLSSEAELKRGVINGIERSWYANGQLEEEVTCELGITLHLNRWDEAGNLTEVFDLKETDSDYKSLRRMRDVVKRWDEAGQ